MVALESGAWLIFMQVIPRNHLLVNRLRISRGYSCLDDDYEVRSEGSEVIDVKLGETCTLGEW
jgi:hypothetical protein